MKHEAEPNDAADSIVVDCELADPPAKVWRALTEPKLLAAWLMPNDIRPEVGARFTFQADAEAGGGVIACEVVAAEPPHLLRYSWRGSDAGRDARAHTLDSVVTFVLTETADGGTHLRLIHDGFPVRALQPVARHAQATPEFVDLAAERAHRRARRPVPPSANAGTRWGLRWAA
jgi:uncharacterized protein YndB with AHSA1/START domain